MTRARTLIALVAGLASPAGPLADELARLVGQDVSVGDGGASLAIRDIAGEGAPLVGTVERRGAELWLSTGARALRLEGPLAAPRIAGPGYRVWVIGDVNGSALRAERIGVLSPPEAGSGRRPDGE